VNNKELEANCSLPHTLVAATLAAEIQPAGILGANWAQLGRLLAAF